MSYSGFSFKKRLQNTRKKGRYKNNLRISQNETRKVFKVSKNKRKGKIRGSSNDLKLNLFKWNLLKFVNFIIFWIWEFKILLNIHIILNYGIFLGPPVFKNLNLNLKIVIFNFLKFINIGNWYLIIPFSSFNDYLSFPLLKSKAISSFRIPQTNRLLDICCKLHNVFHW